jgi:hypothetical protein
MLETMLTSVESVIVILAVGVSLRYLAGLDWPWALLIGAGVSVALRRLIRSGSFARVKKHR